MYLSYNKRRLKENIIRSLLLQQRDDQTVLCHCLPSAGSEIRHHYLDTSDGMGERVGGGEFQLLGAMIKSWSIHRTAQNNFFQASTSDGDEFGSVKHNATFAFQLWQKAAKSN